MCGDTPIAAARPRASLRSNLDDPEEWELPCSDGESVCWDEAHRMEPVACRPIIKCGTTGCTGSCPKSVVGHGYTAVKEPDTCGICVKTNWVSPNVLPREQSAPFGEFKKEVLREAASGPREPSEPGLFSSGYGKASEHAVISSFPVSAVGGTSGPAVISSFSAEVTAPSSSPLRNVTSTPESSGESCGTVTRTTKRTSSTHLVPVVPSGVELVYISRKKRNSETCWRQSKALKRVQREAKRKLVAQPEISHEAAEAILRSQAARTDEKFPGIMHVSHQLALLHGHKNVFFCTQRGAVNAGGSLTLRATALANPARKRDANLSEVWSPTTMLWQMRSAHFKYASFSLTLLDALTHRALSISLVIKKTDHQKRCTAQSSSSALMGKDHI